MLIEESRLRQFGRDSGENFLDRNSGRDLPQAVPSFEERAGRGVWSPHGGRPATH
jgi:hypothetical protein